MLIIAQVISYIIPAIVAYFVWTIISQAPQGGQTPGLFWQAVPPVFIGGVIEMVLILLQQNLVRRKPQGMSPHPYQEQFPTGSYVWIASEAELREFMLTWKFHHKLKPEQVQHVGERRKVKDVSFYHGGDRLYELQGLPDFLWHEQCLRSG